MKNLIIILIFSGCLKASAQTAQPVSNESKLELFIQRLKQELNLTEQQAKQIVDLRREEIRVLDSIQLVEKIRGIRFNPRSFIKACDEKMKSILTPLQLEKLHAINRKRKEAVEQKLYKTGAFNSQKKNS
jgi:Spy/CpxP family protein refolding chaperone